VYPVRCATAQLRSTTRHFAQWYLILTFFQHSKYNTVYIYIYRIILLTLGTLHCLCVCVVAQLHALRAQQSKHLLSVEFSQREHWLPPTKLLRLRENYYRICSFVSYGLLLTSVSIFLGKCRAFLSKPIARVFTLSLSADVEQLRLSFKILCPVILVLFSSSATAL